jgi:low temperature requirement protein LtrA
VIGVVARVSRRMVARSVTEDHRARTTWHPHHIAERHGLFTLIVLGECVFAVSSAVTPQADSRLLRADLVRVAVGGLVLLFALWWIYFLKPAAAVLDRERRHGFRWSYGHYGIFAALAALGAGLEVAAERAARAGVGGPASDVTVTAAVAVPVAAFLVLVWALHASAARHPARDGVVAGIAAAATLAPSRCAPRGCR